MPGSDPARAARGPRPGALIKVVFEQGDTGYADLHPWEKFGHPPLETHLTSLNSERPTPLASLALRHARNDAAARRAGVSLFAGLPEVRSHALFTDWTAVTRSVFDQCAAEGYAAAKLKVGRDPGCEATAMNHFSDLPLRWRLDANASFTSAASLAGFLDRLSPPMRNNIEFLEDPFAYDPTAWSAISEKERVNLALDWELPKTPPPWPGARILVIKPAWQDAFPLALAAAQAGMKIVITHSMDHPLGQSVALWTAMRLRQRHGDLVRDGGLQSIGLYQPDDFTSEIQTKGPRTIPPSGTGFGFDDKLSTLRWTLL